MVNQNIAKAPSVWMKSAAKTVTFMVTEDCQLRCHYCYLVGKNAHTRMDFEVARQAIDYLVENRDLFPEQAIVWDFIGGEPLLEIGLIDRICAYIEYKQRQQEHPWAESYRFSLTSNGILYDKPAVQQFVAKNRDHLSIGITIDGTPEKHDLHRVYPSGKGSYADTARNIPLWLAQFPGASTKVTVASDDLPHVADSVLHLFALGIQHVSINVVFEDVWREGDERIFEKQLLELADRIIDGNLYAEHTCSFFSEHIGQPVQDNHNWCGTGRMLTVDCQGHFYPCHRFTPFSLARKEAITIGNCRDGIDFNKLRPFLSLDRFSQSSEACRTCEVASGCAWCQGANYDYADTDTIFQRATYLCNMHKARVRANNYYWYKLKRKLASERCQ